jgi:hypothetical protein
MNRPLTLAEMQRIRHWHLAHKDEHPLEYQLWDAVLCLWLMGWVGWMPVLLFELLWVLPLCLLASTAPRLYVVWRARAHRMQRLRCDWLGRRS